MNQDGRKKCMYDSIVAGSSPPLTSSGESGSREGRGYDWCAPAAGRGGSVPQRANLITLWPNGGTRSYTHHRPRATAAAADPPSARRSGALAQRRVTARGGWQEASDAIKGTREKRARQQLIAVRIRGVPGLSLK